jgi:hypothetical protein
VIRVRHAGVKDVGADVTPNFGLFCRGDLDGMIDRRLIRILAPYSKTFYFVDRGVQRGLIYEIGEMLERDLLAEERALTDPCPRAYCPQTMPCRTTSAPRRLS